jgi:hypothetical protein
MLTQLCRVAQLYADTRAKNDKPVLPGTATVKVALEDRNKERY